MEMMGGCDPLVRPVADRNNPGGADVMGTTAAGTCVDAEVTVTLALLVRIARTGRVISMFVCKVRSNVTTLDNRRFTKLVGCTTVFVKPPGGVFVKPNTFVSANMALLVSGMAKTGGGLVWAIAELIGNVFRPIKMTHANTKV